jgi:hypothetical protein
LLPPLIFHLADTRAYAGDPIRIEGWLITELYEQLAERLAGRLRCCLAGSPGLDPRATLARIGKYDEEHANDWLHCRPSSEAGRFARISSGLSQEYREAAADLGVPFFDLSDFDAGVGAAVAYLKDGRLG